MLTAYDALTAEWLESLGVDMILVGDSVGMVVLGYPDTTKVTPEEMIHHIKAVRRGAKKSFIIGDLPLKGVEQGPHQALETARRFLKEGPCDAVKIEWHGERTRPILDLFLAHKIPFVGHAGLAPQIIKAGKKFRVQGRSGREAYRIYSAARHLEKMGALSLILECIPDRVAKEITSGLSIPTIGIGAGPHCDGQVLVFHDLVGLFDKFKPKFAQRYAHISNLSKIAIAQFMADVQSGNFPDKAHSYPISDEEWFKFIRRLRS